MLVVYQQDKQFSKPIIYRLDKSSDILGMKVEQTRLQNFRRLLKETKERAKDAAAKLEMEPSQFSQFAGANPVRNIGRTLARRIENAWGKPEGWLDVTPSPQLSLQEPSSDYNVAEGPAVVTEVPLISWVQAGNWREVIDNLQPGQGRPVPTTVRVGPHAYALRVVGDSMTNPHGTPSFPENTVIVLDPDRRAEPGKFVVVRQSDDTEVTFKQLVRDGGKYYLKPLNPRYPIIEMKDDAVVCGVLVQAVMDF